MATMRALPATTFEDRPLGEMNTTPLIDVMLVLLIMFIMTIPIATHSLAVDLRGGGDVSIEPDPVHNRVTLPSMAGSSGTAAASPGRN